MKNSVFSYQALLLKIRFAFFGIPALTLLFAFQNQASPRSCHQLFEARKTSSPSSLDDRYGKYIAEPIELVMPHERKKGEPRQPSFLFPNTTGGMVMVLERRSDLSVWSGLNGRLLNKHAFPPFAKYVPELASVGEPKGLVPSRVHHGMGREFVLTFSTAEKMDLLSSALLYPAMSRNFITKSQKIEDVFIRFEWLSDGIKYVIDNIKKLSNEEVDDLQSEGKPYYTFRKEFRRAFAGNVPGNFGSKASFSLDVSDPTIVHGFWTMRKTPGKSKASRDANEFQIPGRFITLKQFDSLDGPEGTFFLTETESDWILTRMEVVDENYHSQHSIHLSRADFPNLEVAEDLRALISRRSVIIPLEPAKGRRKHNQKRILAHFSFSEVYHSPNSDENESSRNTPLTFHGQKYYIEPDIQEWVISEDLLSTGIVYQSQYRIYQFNLPYPKRDFSHGLLGN